MAAPGTSEIAEALKQALGIGARRVVGRLGRADGFNASGDVHIPLPGTLATVQKTLSRFGMGDLGRDLELRLNRAAEAAVPRAGKLFADAISALTLDDVRRIYDGPDDAATRYFQKQMSVPLASSMRPIVDQELAGAGAIAAYDDMMGKYRALPFVPDAKADLVDYVLGRALDGVFTYLAREEASIRRNPARRTTELLQRVFGARR